MPKEHRGWSPFTNRTVQDTVRGEMGKTVLPGGCEQPSASPPISMRGKRENQETMQNVSVGAGTFCPIWEYPGSSASSASDATIWRAAGDIVGSLPPTWERRRELHRTVGFSTVGH